ncbi:MAG TPA: helix-turn-helix transcriptional regulator [Thermoanaerobaculia bacterium]|nr:helix-turn-helix transcriptional regulator [Thermoanaerobaculia bacterium]HRU10910.1 helix-turn-helix transcriptional regulator [Thermoanaerobaculia bacterium]
MAWTGASRLRSVLGRRTQQSLATALGVNQGTVSKWLSRHRTPDIETLMRLCLELGVSADYLLGLADDPLLRAHPETDEIREDATNDALLRPAIAVLLSLLDSGVIAKEDLLEAYRRRDAATKPPSR